MEGVLGVPHLDSLIGQVPENSRIMLMADPGTDGPEMLWHAAAYLASQGETVVLVAWDRAPDRIREALRRHGMSAADQSNAIIVDAHSGQFTDSQDSDYTLDDGQDPYAVRDLLETVAREHPDSWVVFDSLSGAYDTLGADAHDWRMVTEALARFRGVLGLFTRWPYLDPNAPLDPKFEAVFKLSAVEDGVIRNQAFNIQNLMWRGQWDENPRFIAMHGGTVEVVMPKLVVVGPEDAGKTTFIQTVSDTVDGTDRNGTTVALDRGRYEADGVKAEVWGTPGQVRFDALLDNLLSHATGAVVLVDSTRPETFARARDLMERVHRIGIGFAVVANKQDQEGARSDADVRAALGVPAHVPVIPCKAINPTSAKATIHHLVRSLLAMGVRP